MYFIFVKLIFVELFVNSLPRLEHEDIILIYIEIQSGRDFFLLLRLF